MDLNAIWFLLIGVLMFGYAALDGFDLGVGVMHLFAPSEEQRRTNMAATVATFLTASYLFEGILSKPPFWIIIAAMLAGIVGVPSALRAKAYVRALLASSLIVASLIGLMGVSLYPRMVPSSIDLHREHY